MARNINALLSVASVLLLLAGCSSTPHQRSSVDEQWHAQEEKQPTLSEEDKANYVNAREKAMAREYALLSDRQVREAYQRGARDTLEDFKGRMRAKAGFVWEPPLVEMVEMPAAQVNGAIYPAHRAPVIIRPGRWVEDNGVALPDLEGRQ